MHLLRYDRPAREWTEALPIGNGYQGAMVFGGTDTERIQINDGTAWSGSPASEHQPPVATSQDARSAIAGARAALDSGNPVAADAYVRTLLHRYSQAYLPFADLEIRITPSGAGTGVGATGWRRPTDEYERCLELDSALHRVRYLRDGITVHQDTYASAPDRVLIHRVRTDAPVDVTITLSSPLRTLGSFGPASGAAMSDAIPLDLGLLLLLPSDVSPIHDGIADPILWDPAPGASLRGAITIGLQHDGSATPPFQEAAATAPPTLTLHAVTTIDLVISTATSFTGIGLPPEGDEHTASARATAAVRAVHAMGIAKARRRQTEDYQRLYQRMNWQPASQASDPELQHHPLDARLTSANAVPGSHPLARDHQLAPLLFHYGRYLLISCSRRGGTPANLQGIWNENMRPPWSSNYTVNINLEMNYWGADAANLPETLTPLFDLTLALSRTGRDTAQRLYAARGWVAHHNADIWAYSHPIGLYQSEPKWAFWPFAGPWLVRHLHDHLSFGGRSVADPDAFTRDVVWPVTRSAAEFVLDWLVDMGDGTVGTSPSTSPENDYRTAEGRTAAVARSSTLDLSLARELLTSVARLAEKLGHAEDEVAAEARRILPRIPGPTLGRDGTIREWLDDPVATDPQHRHQSHLYPVYPGTESLSPDLRAGAVRSLDLRGDESTGWSLVWRIALRARLRQPDAVDRLLALLMRDMTTDRGGWSGGLYPNLFAAHPPFQIDANLGYVAAVAECLVQSHGGKIVLLPAIPKHFAAATITGLVARPGVQVDLTWNERQELVSARLTPLTASARTSHEVVYGNASCVVDLDDAPASGSAPAPVELTPESFVG